MFFGSAGASYSTGFNLISAAYDSNSFDTTSQAAQPRSMVIGNADTKLYIVDSVGTDTIYQYSFSGNISTASYDSKSYAPSQSTITTDIFIKPDGLSFYSISNGTVIHQYTMSSAWDISTSSYASKSFDTTSEIASTKSLFFKGDGTAMYVLGTNGSAQFVIFQYSLSTAWDVSTATYASKSLNIHSVAPNAKDFFISSSGFRLFFLDSNASADVYQYKMPTLWDISSGVDESISVDLSALDTLMYAIHFNSLGTKFYALGDTDDVIYQHST